MIPGFRGCCCRSLGLALLLVGLAASAAAAQGRPWEDRGFFNVNFAQQTTERRAVASDSFPIYDETATFESTVGAGSASMADVAGGWRVWRNLAVGVGYTRYSDASAAVVTGSVPDPLFFDTPHPFSSTRADQRHTENAVHLSATWVAPIGDKLDVAVFAGPSFVSLSKDLVSGIAVEPGTSNVQSIAATRISETGTGGHVGFDIRYTVLEDLSGIRRVGVGLFARYSSASVDAPVDGGKIDVGGFNYGIGFRIGF